MKIVLCDDDKKDMERLKQLISAYGEERDMGFTIDTYTSGVELLKAMEKERMDISEQGHGIGLVNVREVVGRYDGSFVISCDDKEFASVVLI